jgi:hypothetical protein
MRQILYALFLKNVIFWDVAPCRPYVNLRSSETWVHTRSTQHHIQKTAFFLLLFYYCVCYSLVIIRTMWDTPFKY